MGSFLFWDHILYRKSRRLPIVDPWVALAAVAMNTENIRIGTTVTPVARRRAWKLARETSTLDRFSGGRLILSVGLGDPPDAEFKYFGEETDDKVRAAKLDEGLEILVGLW
jgi:alkanesulfonate monooxygenase SsuD/methylene tetrahydromethanopterin reductase-like flavin-dependent oxidoreductase (luciferase family)